MENISILFHLFANLFTYRNIIRHLHCQKDNGSIVFFNNGIAKLGKTVNKPIHLPPVAHRNHNKGFVQRNTFCLQKTFCVFLCNALHGKYRVSCHKALFRIYTHGKKFIIGVFLSEGNQIRTIYHLFHQPPVSFS
ncbi:hypothetical protein SDC9_168253 [bioreactor metagenome]|uniref:Uncharacterized protein n=1 Tax=bioreactor metagenome TaxID=1076179 RepID=A0A645G9X4_9ZZZZ